MAADIRGIQPDIYPSRIDAMPKHMPVDKASIGRAAKEFESLFLAQMLQQMFADIKLVSSFGEDNTANDVYQSYLVDEYGKTMARAGGIGIADYVQRELLRLQEAKPV